MRSLGCGKVESLKAASALGLILEPDFDIAFQLQRERLALAIKRLASGNADPAFRYTILLDIGFLGSIEADTDFALQQICIVKLAVWIKGEAVWERVGHVMLFASECGNCKSPDAT